MLDIKFIRKNPEKIKKACQKRGNKVDIDRLLKLDEERRQLLSEIEKLKAKKNKAGKEISKTKNKVQLIKEMKRVDVQEEKLKPKLQKIEKEFNELILQVPNIPADDVPEGKNELENKVIKKHGQPTKFSFQPKDHIAIAENLDLIDVKRAGKISGSRFSYLKNEAVILEFAIIKYTLDLLLKEGFVPFISPVLVKEEMMQGVGYASYLEGQEAYYLPKDKIYLVGTGEHALVTYHTNEVLAEENLPLRYTTFSTCFRREAGSYGKDTRGILRVHQFDKLEMVSYARPENSNQEFKNLLSIQEKLVQGLELPYHLLQVCTGDLPKPSVKVIDLECWLPSENKYRETHSVSNCTDFQTRRLNIRYRDKKNKLQFVHALNATAFAIGRILIAILENNQQKDGTIKVPAILQKYCGFKVIK